MRQRNKLHLTLLFAFVVLTVHFSPLQSASTFVTAVTTTAADTRAVKADARGLSTETVLQPKKDVDASSTASTATTALQSNQPWIKSFRDGVDPVEYFKAIYPLQGAATVAAAGYRSAFARDQVKAFVSLFDMMKNLDRRPAGSPPSCLNDALGVEINKWNDTINSALDVLDAWGESMKSKVAEVIYPKTTTPPAGTTGGGSTGGGGTGSGGAVTGAGTKFLEVGTFSNVAVDASAEDRIYLAPAQTIEQLYLASSLSSEAEKAVFNLYSAHDKLFVALKAVGSPDAGGAVPCDVKALQIRKNPVDVLKSSFPTKLAAIATYAVSSASGRKVRTNNNARFSGDIEEE